MTITNVEGAYKGLCAVDFRILLNRSRFKHFAYLQDALKVDKTIIITNLHKEVDMIDMFFLFFSLAFRYKN